MRRRLATFLLLVYPAISIGGTHDPKGHKAAKKKHKQAKIRKQRTLLTAEAAFLKDSAMEHIREKRNTGGSRNLQSSADCYETSDGGEKCCDIIEGVDYCITVWCNEYGFECNVCELEFDGTVCNECVLCNDGDDLGFDCNNYLPGLEENQCDEPEPGPSGCRFTSDGTYECCDHSTGKAICVTLDVTVTLAGINAEPSKPGPQPGPQPDCGPVDNSTYGICIDALKTGTYTKDWTPSVAAAKTRWESIITGNLPAVDIRVSQYPLELLCNTPPDIVDDVYICFKDPVIDGPGGVLGRAGPVLLRTDTSLPASGIMEFDSADIQVLIDEGNLEEIITHEMGHVLGLGTLWEDSGLVSNQGTDLFPDYVYKSSSKACQMWQKITGCPGCPPVENEFGEGTRGGHWDEDVMGDELMSGFAEDPWTFMPISNITIGSLEDLGYVVDFSAADPYITAPSCGQGSLRKKRDSKGNNRHLKRDRKRPKLSKVGAAKATEYGKLMLAKAGAEKPESLPPGLSYFADRFVNVLYLEHGTVHAVGVGAGPLL